MAILPGFIRDMLQRRKLKQVVSVLPHALKDRYGRQNLYTPGQVKMAAHALNIKAPTMPYAFALACLKEDFIGAFPTFGTEGYDEKRHELARLFRLDLADLTCLALTRKGLGNPVGRTGGFRPTDASGMDF